jgi:hypothetical protein
MFSGFFFLQPAFCYPEVKNKSQAYVQDYRDEPGKS